MSDKQQSAVDFLVEELRKYGSPIPRQLEDQAKELFKQQIIDAFWNGDNTDCLSEQNSKEFAEQYFNETFKTESNGK